jgi:hypothetical protein
VVVSAGWPWQAGLYDDHLSHVPAAGGRRPTDTSRQLVCKSGSRCMDVWLRHMTCASSHPHFGMFSALQAASQQGPGSATEHAAYVWRNCQHSFNHRTTDLVVARQSSDAPARYTASAALRRRNIDGRAAFVCVCICGYQRFGLSAVLTQPGGRGQWARRLLISWLAGRIGFWLSLDRLSLTKPVSMYQFTDHVRPSSPATFR